MERRQPLRADPERTREWQRRSAETAAVRREERARQAGGYSGLKRTTELGRNPQTPGSRLGSGLARASAQPLSAKAVPFKAKRPARTQRCFRLSCGSPAAHWHHWLAQEHLRVFLRSQLRYRPTEEVQALLRRLLRDERNLSPVCSRCHAQGESEQKIAARAHTGARQRGRFLRSEVPASAYEFATELDDMLEAEGRPREAMVRLLREWT